MSLRRRSAVLLAALVATTAPLLGAQARPEPAGRFLVGGGLDPRSGELDDGGARALQLGYERRLGDSRFGLRLEGSRWSRTTRFDALVDGTLQSAFRARRIEAVSLLGTYRFGSAGRVRPYALAGVGLQQSSVRTETDWVVQPIGIPGGLGGRKVVLSPPRRVNAAAYTGGLGLDVPLGRASLFLEGRATATPGGAGQAVLTPLTVGFRF
jgi:opacity protein-like surface antigen